MQLLETTIVHRILETLNWTRHNPHEEGNTTEPGSPRTAETAQLNGTAGGHRPTAKKNCRWEAAETVLSIFASLGGAGSVATRPHLLEPRASPNTEFLIAPTPCVRPLLLHLVFGGFAASLFLPKQYVRHPNVPRIPVIPPARHVNCCKIQGQHPPHWPPRAACTGWPCMWAGRACGRDGRLCTPASRTSPPVHRDEADPAVCLLTAVGVCRLSADCCRCPPFVC